MSVLVKKLKSQTIEAYVKGAPEVMLDICDKSTCEFARTTTELCQGLPILKFIISAVGLSRSAGELYKTRVPRDCTCRQKHTRSDLDEGSAAEAVSNGLYTECRSC